MTGSCPEKSGRLGAKTISSRFDVFVVNYRVLARILDIVSHEK
jgi:hypothetical protein